MNPLIPVLLSGALVIDVAWEWLRHRLDREQVQHERRTSLARHLRNGEHDE